MRRATSLALALALAACGRQAEGPCAGRTSDAASPAIPVTIEGPGKRSLFCAELADTPEEQAKGLMFRTDLADDFAMLFAPYPPVGDDAREASFWMKNTPSALDILFIRADGTVARIAQAVPFDETPVTSGEPVSAVLEVRGGRTAALGIAEGDRVRWPAVETAAPAR